MAWSAIACHAKVRRQHTPTASVAAMTAASTGVRLPARRAPRVDPIAALRIE